MPRKQRSRTTRLASGSRVSAGRKSSSIARRRAIRSSSARRYDVKDCSSAGNDQRWTVSQAKRRFSHGLPSGNRRPCRSTHFVSRCLARSKSVPSPLGTGAERAPLLRLRWSRGWPSARRRDTTPRAARHHANSQRAVATVRTDRPRAMLGGESDWPKTRHISRNKKTGFTDKNTNEDG